MSWAEHIISGLIGVAGGYIASMYAQRISVINVFAGVVEKELNELAARSDNVGGEYDIATWHRDSARRIKAFASILGDRPYLQEEDFREALAEYCSKNIDYLAVGRTGLIEKLCRLYRTAKKLA